MELKKIKKLLLGLVVVTFAAGCGDDDDDKPASGGDGTTESQPGAKAVNGQFKVGPKENYVLLAPAGGLLEGSNESMSLALATNSYYLLSINSDNESVPKEVSKDLKITLSVHGLAANNSITINAFSKLTQADGIITALPNTHALGQGIKVLFAGAADNAVGTTVHLNNAEDLIAKYPLTSVAGTDPVENVFNNVVVRIGKGAAGDSAKAPSVKVLHSVTNVALTSGDDGNDDLEKGTTDVEVLSTDLLLDSDIEENSRSNSEDIVNEHGQVVDNNCEGQTADITSGVKQLNFSSGGDGYAHFDDAATTIGSSSDGCGKVADFQRIANTATAIAGDDHADHKHVGISLSGSAVTLTALKVEEVEAN